MAAAGEMSSKRISFAIGEKLMRGWTLASESCPKCIHAPLIKNSLGELYCVNCETEISKEFPITSQSINNGKVAPRSLIQEFGYTSRGVAGGPAPSAGSSFSPMPNRLADPTKASSAIAQKLLQGWTLLGETCPVEGCLVPLMLDPKTAVKHCVNSEVCGYCDEQFGPPLSFQQRKELEDKLEDGKLNESELGKSLKFSNEENGRLSPPKASDHARSPSSRSPTRGAILFRSTNSSSKSALDESTVLVAAKRAILSKMFSCSEALISCGDVNESKALMSLLTESLQALQVANSLSVSSSSNEEKR